ncbi:hypothetical protein ACFSCW_02685 [Sphingomonas tabacisoli]|uniref:Lipoprotein n=1 Tax=Sphingomonas tabacisoli TaxID=2249466 RepID=A0ABW4HYG6_9SPHN
MRRAIGFSLLMLSACVAPQQAAPPPLPRPTPTPTPTPLPPPPPADWRDRAYTSGDWSYARSGGQSEARYGETGALPRLALTCDPRAAQVRMTWPGAPAGPLIVRTSDGDMTLQAAASDAGLLIVFAARDPMLDRIAYSRGRFMLQASAQELIVPSWPEISRVIEDCR